MKETQDIAERKQTKKPEKNPTNLKRVVFLVGRDNWQKDDLLNHVLLTALKKTNCKIIWEDPAGNILYKLRRLESKFKWIPELIRGINLRLTQFFYGLIHWNYFLYLSGRQTGSIELRCQKLKNSILELGTENEIIIISRSSGGRISSIVADDLKIKHIICLGYPFKNPTTGIEPERYLHLKNLKTPMLIVQGTKDEYGGYEEILREYALSPAIELFFVDANHEFKIDHKDWRRVLAKIEKIIG